MHPSLVVGYLTCLFTHLSLVLCHIIHITAVQICS